MLLKRREANLGFPSIPQSVNSPESSSIYFDVDCFSFGCCGVFYYLPVLSCSMDKSLVFSSVSWFVVLAYMGHRLKFASIFVLNISC